MKTIEQSELLLSQIQQKQYFPIESFQQDLDLVKGKCLSMVSDSQLDQRGLEQFEKYPFKPIARYFRNKIYNKPEEARTPQALDESLKYLKETFLICILNDKKKIQKIISKQIKQKHQNNEQSSKQKIFQEDKFQKIWSIIEKESDLGLIQQTSFEEFQTKNEKRSIQSSSIKQKTLHIEQLLSKHTTKQKTHKDFVVPEKILVFLETRLQAIRCELYAQGIIFPRLTLQLLKCEIFLYTLKEYEYSNIGEDINSYEELRLVGLDVLLDESIKGKLSLTPQFKHYYLEALTIAIFRYKIRQLTKLIEYHEQIFTDEKLCQYLQLRLSIERGNYHKYFSYLRQTEDVFVSCLLLTHLQKMRLRLCQVLESAKIDVKKSWLGFLLGLVVKTEEENEIINLNKNIDYLKEKHQKNEIQTRQKQLKNWFSLEDLFDQLIINDKQTEIENTIKNQ